jgi:hypothetical protein
MASIDDFATPSNGLKAADLEGSEITLTIKSYEAKEFDEKGRNGETYKALKPVFSFHETDKTFVMNKTNREAVAYAYGKEMDDWLDKEITLYPTIVPFGDKKVEAIRVRAVKQSAGAPSFLKSNPKVAAQKAQAPLDDEIPF